VAVACRALGFLRAGSPPPFSARPFRRANDELGGRHAGRVGVLILSGMPAP